MVAFAHNQDGTASASRSVFVPKEVGAAATLMFIQGGFWAVCGIFWTLLYLAAFLSGTEDDRWIGLPFALMGAFGLTQVATGVGLYRVRPWSPRACWATSFISFSLCTIGVLRVNDWLFRLFVLAFVALFHFYGCVCLLQRRARQAFRNGAIHRSAANYVVEEEQVG
jgi:uncharacterized membrane protein